MKDFQVGDRVRIKSVSTPSYSRYSLKDEEGTIYKISSDRYGILLEGKSNPASLYGVYWFKSHEIVLVKDSLEDSKMKLRGFNKVALVHIGNSQYAYALYDDGVEYKLGDTVMVSGDYRNPVKIEHILPADDPRFDDLNITAEVICKLDYTAYNKRVADRNRVLELITEMDKKIKEMDEINKYEMYAKNNPELAKMLEELKILRG